MDDLLLFLSSSSAEQQWSLHVLEIISLMFRDQVGPYLY
jgi:timeless